MPNEHKLHVAEESSSVRLIKAALPKAGNKPTKVLPTARIAFPKQLDILRAFAAASGPQNRLVNLREVSDIVKMATGTITLANPFLVDVKLLSRTEGVGLTPSPAVMEFSRAYEWNPDTAAQKLAPVLSRAWFAEALLPRLAFGDILEDEAVAILAEKSSSPPNYKTQLRLILDYLEAAGIIRRENGSVKAARATVTSPAAHARSEQQQASEERAAKPVSGGKVITAFTEPTQGVVNFHIDVRMDMAEFANWEADRIAAFFGGIAQVLSAKAGIEQNASAEKE